MPCYHPLKGYRSREVNPTGKRSIVFSQSKGFADMPIEVPCGQCIGCRLERSRQWAIRCVHEASLYSNNCFITLTYNPENLPSDGTLVKAHYQKFMKRLRKRFSGIDAVENNGKITYPIRYYMCGEYGEKNSRPHYHACLFNFDFPDKELINITSNGDRVYVSDSLADLWTFGFHTIGSVSFESAAYVARYVTKKITGAHAIDHYNDIDYYTGEILSERIPEYTTMSRRPGIAQGWYDKYSDDTYKDDFVVLNGKKMRPSKFYDTKLEKENKKLFDKIKRMRIINAKYSDDCSPERLEVREKLQHIRANKLKRSFENEI